MPMPCICILVALWKQHVYIVSIKHESITCTEKNTR